MATPARVGQGPGRNLPWISDGPLKRTVTDVTLDSSYTEGGEAITAADLGFQQYVTHASAQVKTGAVASADAAFAGYDPAAALLHVYDETPAEAASGANLATVVVRVTAWGI